jgi:hypothetical protein
MRQLRQRSTRKCIARRSWQLGILRRKRPNVHTYKIQILCVIKDADRYTGAEFAHFMLNGIDDNLLLQVILTDEAAFHTLWIGTWTGTMVESVDRCDIMRDRFYRALLSCWKHYDGLYMDMLHLFVFSQIGGI